VFGASRDLLRPCFPPKTLPFLVGGIPLFFQGSRVDCPFSVLIFRRQCFFKPSADGRSFCYSCVITSSPCAGLSSFHRTFPSLCATLLPVSFFSWPLHPWSRLRTPNLPLIGPSAISPTITDYEEVFPCDRPPFFSLFSFPLPGYLRWRINPAYVPDFSFGFF